MKNKIYLADHNYPAENLIMPAENLEEEGLEKNPNLELAQLKFLLNSHEYRKDESLKKKLMEGIKADSNYCF